MDNKTKILFIAEKSPWCYTALDFLKKHFSEIQSIFWNHGDPDLPIINWKGEWIFSFKSDLILSKDNINSATKGAINFHPAPPKYRGIGGYHYAIHNNDTTYGTTCHHISEAIDKGKIICVRFFDIEKNETASSLREKTAKYSYNIFCEIIQKIVVGKSLPISEEVWEKKLYTYKYLNEFLDNLKSKNIIE